MLRENLPPVIILSSLWLVMAVVGYRISDTDLFGAVMFGFLAALVLGLPVTLIVGLTANLSFRIVNWIAERKNSRRYLRG